MQTCGSPSSGQESCWSSSCGGLGCVDPDGQARCGGEGCDGAVTAANSILLKTQETEKEIISAMAEVEKLSKMVGHPSPGFCHMMWTFGTVFMQTFSSGVRGEDAG